MLSTTPEFYINMKSIPDKDSSEYRAFFLNELDKITYGVTINGVYIHGWLYFHLNHWHLYKDVLDPRNGDIKREFKNPDMRDNEWIIAEHIKLAEDQKKGLMLFGSRRLGKSAGESSWIGRGATIYEGSENVISSTNSKDLQIVTGLIDKGMNALHPFFKHGRIYDNWNNEVVFGAKDKVGQRYEFSKIAIRNLAGGKNTEAFAGLTPKTFILDEALEENEIVYKKDCKVPIKDIQIGDKIYDDSGKLITVIDKINPGIVDLYEITLSDYRTIKASANHLWKVYNTYRKKYLELTTEELVKKFYFLKRDNRYNKTIKSYIYSLPQNQAINYSKKDLKIDPYWLGLWLGDGGKSATTIYSIDDDIIEYCKNYSKNLHMSYSIRTDINKGNGKFREVSIINQAGQPNKLRNYLRDYNIFENKHIPNDYLYSSTEDRLELLRGLMDTDGSVNKFGHIEFSSSQEGIAKTVEILLRELGISFHINKCIKTFSYKGEKKNGNTCWRFQLNTNLKIFKLKRKLANYNRTQSGVNKLKSDAYKTRITITDIKPIGKGQAYCIKVDNESKLFLTSNCIVTHNCGKEDFGEAFESAKPSFTTPFGWRCQPWICGTGGTLGSGSDAENYFKNPEANNFVPVYFPNKTKPYGLFISGLNRMEGKVETTAKKYLETRHGILVPEDSELATLKFFDTDELKAKAVIQDELDKALLDKDPKAYLKQRMYFPEDPDDCFLTDDGNEFPVDALKEHLTYLESLNDFGECVELFKKPNGDIEYKAAPLNKKIIWDFPVNKDTIKDAPIVIYEHPMEKKPPYGLYVSGLDVYNQSQSINSESLGTIYIYKRMYDPAGGTWQDSIVASYASRPNTMKEWHENIEMLLEYYNAICMPENEGGTLIQYFDQKNKAHLLADGYSLARQINPKTSITGRTKGLPATKSVQNFYKNLVIEYLIEDVQIGTNDIGEPMTKMGLVRIKDPMLLRELISYRKDSGNYDRYIAFGHTLCCRVMFDKLYPVIKFAPEENINLNERKPMRSPFIFERARPF